MHLSKLTWNVYILFYGNYFHIKLTHNTRDNINTFFLKTLLITLQTLLLTIFCLIFMAFVYIFVHLIIDFVVFCKKKKKNWTTNKNCQHSDDWHMLFAIFSLLSSRPQPIQVYSPQIHLSLNTESLNRMPQFLHVLIWTLYITVTIC